MAAEREYTQYPVPVSDQRCAWYQRRNYPFLPQNISRSIFTLAHTWGHQQTCMLNSELCRRLTWEYQALKNWKQIIQGLVVELISERG